MAARQEAPRANDTPFTDSSEPDGAGAPAANKRRTDFFLKAPLGMLANPALMRVAGRTKQPLPNVLCVWLALQESAQTKDAGGEFDVDADFLAFQLRLSAEDIEAIIVAFTASDVGLIVDGRRLATFLAKTYASERRARYDNCPEVKAQRKARARRNAEGERPPPDAGQRAAREDSDPPRVEPIEIASESDAQASDMAPCRTLKASDTPIESSSESRREERDSLPSVVVLLHPHGRASEQTTMTDAEILDSIERLSGASLDRTRALPSVAKLRRLLAKHPGIDFERDAIPALSEAAQDVAEPLRNLASGWALRRILGRRDLRLAGALNDRGDRGASAPFARAEKRAPAKNLYLEAIAESERDARSGIDRSIRL